MSWTLTVARTDDSFVAVATPIRVTVAATEAHGTAAAAVAVHTGDATDAHDASAISFTPTGTLAATNVQDAIAEAASEGGGGGASAAEDVTFTPAGTIAATDVQAALEELDGDSRMSDSRTPTAHATSHQDGGTDELALDGSQITAGTVADARIASTIARDSEVTTAANAAQTAAESTASSALFTHVADTTDAHALAGITGLQTALDAKAALASPAFTGNPTAPTPSVADNDTSIATTAFVTAAVAAGGGSSAPPTPHPFLFAG